MSMTASMMTDKRAKFLQTCTELELSDAIVLTYTRQMRGKTDTEKDEMADRFTKEIVEKYGEPQADRT